MSRWIKSSEIATEHPFLLVREEVRITSLDEFAFLLEQGKILFIEDVMNEDFCLWVRNALHEKKKGESLLQLLNAQGKTMAFFQCLFRNSSYLPEERLEEILIPFSSDSYGDESERHYRVGNQFFKKERFRSAIFSYREALRCGELEKKEDQWMGRVWHQLGNCYMNDLRFEQGADCFQRAYLLNGQILSQQALILAQQASNQTLAWDLTVNEELDMEDTLEKLKKEVMQGIR